MLFMNQCCAYERMQKEPYTLLINESLSKTLNIKINEIVKVQDQEFLQ